MQHKRVEVGAIWPHDGAQLLIDLYPCEEPGIGKWLEHGAVQLACEIDVS